MANFTNNTTQLQSLLAKVNELPEAGSGGGAEIETCNVTITDRNDFVEIWYSDIENGNLTEPSCFNLSSPATIAIPKNTLFSLLYFSSLGFSCSDNIIPISRGGVDAPWIFFAIGDGTIENNPCFVHGTLILLSDGTTKPVQDINYNDELLVWDFDNGCYSFAKPLWIKKPQVTNYYYNCTFDNGTILKLVGSNDRCHRVFSLDRNMFESATECVGERIITNNGITKLISCERIEESVEFYNIITDTHLNLFAEGVLTSCRLNNLYPIQDMKFIKEERESLPIEIYNINKYFYTGLRLSEQSVENVPMLINYIENLYELMENK